LSIDPQGGARQTTLTFYSSDRGGEHPERHPASFAGLLQADAYAGFNRLVAALLPRYPFVVR
jgi:transposase